jgi:hypothetical protein
LPDDQILTDTYWVTLQIDTSGYTGGGVAIDTVAVKISNSILSGTLIAAPGNLSDWTLMLNGLNANGCSNGGSGWACADEINVTGSSAPVRGVLTWTIEETIAAGSLLEPPSQSSIKARYVDDAGNKIGALVSEDIMLQQVPEPAVFEIIGCGLLAPILLVWNRRSILRRNP